MRFGAVHCLSNKEKNGDKIWVIYEFKSVVRIWRLEFSHDLVKSGVRRVVRGSMRSALKIN
jgi:hypothetical protein